MYEGIPKTEKRTNKYQIQTKRLLIEGSQTETLDIQRKLQVNTQTDWCLTKIFKQCCGRDRLIRDQEQVRNQIFFQDQGHFFNLCQKTKSLTKQDQARGQDR